MTLKEYKKENNKQIVAELAKITMSHKTTVYRWLNGNTTPPPIKQAIIAKYFNEPIEKLFPTKEL